MRKATVTVEIPSSADATEMAHLVQRAGEFESTIYMDFENKRVNVKSIMGMLGLSLESGDSVTLSCEGSDELQAIRTVAAFLQGRE